MMIRASNRVKGLCEDLFEATHVPISGMPE
jgi:hypothetical protein